MAKTIFDFLFWIQNFIKCLNSKKSTLKIVGVGFGIAVTIDGNIVKDILRKLGAIAAQIGDPIMIMTIWVRVNIYAFLEVPCAIYLEVSILKAGSWYVYGCGVFGKYFGFITGIKI